MIGGTEPIDPCSSHPSCKRKVPEIQGSWRPSNRVSVLGMKRTHLSVFGKVFCLALAWAGCSNARPQTTQPTERATPETTIRTTVRRVVVDVVVSDKKGHPVQKLSKDDFLMKEDGVPQRVLSFEAYGYGQGMDYVPPKLPQMPSNTFVNVPTAPEKGPLYVLLLDLVNIDNEDQMLSDAESHDDQMRGRQQLLKFIRSKPEGTRFAVVVWSDGLHLMQGFTSDKDQLYRVLDPNVSKPHLPKIFLMGRNQGRGNPDETLGVLRQIAHYLDGLPGRKNLIWFSGAFPVVLYPGQDDGPIRTGALKSTFNLLVQNEISIYPVDVRGVVTANAHGSSGLTGNGVSPPSQSASAKSGSGGGSSGQAGSASGGPAPGPHGEGVQQGASLLSDSYSIEDEIAKQTGGRAFYSNNDVSGELAQATEAGETYYTLSYAPKNHEYDGRLRRIEVSLPEKDEKLEYRRSYFATEPVEDEKALSSMAVTDSDAINPEPMTRSVHDALTVGMRHGAPLAHGIVFAAQVNSGGQPAPLTPAEAAQITPPEVDVAGRHKRSQTKGEAAAIVQRYKISFAVFGAQFPSSGGGVKLEIASAAYDADGRMLSSLVNTGTQQIGDKGVAGAASSFRLDQVLAVPAGAASLRFAVRDLATGRIGANEVKLPISKVADQP